MYIVKHRRFFFWVTGLLLAGAIGSIIFYGLPLGIDFKGGSLMHVAYPEGRPELSVIQDQISKIPTGAVSVRVSGDNAVNIRTNTLTPEEHTAILSALSASGTTTELAFTSVGPALGSQFATKALWALFAVALAIVLYIAFAFRKVSRPVPSWGYGLAVVLMLAIDIIVPIGFFAAYAHFTGAEVDSLFVVALLALLGYCVNDVIVVFDRVRDHLHHNEKTGVREEFEVTVGKSIDETMIRSINTSLTTALGLIALIWFGAEATRNFAIIMLVGVVIGAFSSICRSAPLLIPLAKYFARKQ
jgi:preprotein translocase subunit SecF